MKRFLVFFLLATPVWAKCGLERWPVKTLSDKDVSNIESSPVEATITFLSGLQAPSRKELTAALDKRFPPYELKVYKVEAILVGFKLEGDEDFHIVLADPKNAKATMIVEMPSPACMSDALKNNAALLRSSWETRFGKATKKFKNVSAHKILLQVEGYGFFDFIHGQTGVAPNGFELHPVISWQEVFKR